ncbi:uncharacterized protein BP01DRAFT_360020 [Aspergillus saccharolyticus JOP 1030-1]|uniref:Fungal specific transcription factor n=1 Tax=Aspergillus saccharolyticus JOP 1030-1 TaxID=1450539 RepID=A0A319A2Z6_9EURO|nr:hypothetical protein BP01DRAFT_360020 [Aspergillus saccharolyticus JOP 1030-1]PYH41822.1 hypothetical protein BP01DRAFT_360020 [Aspergillus saccharolyticus JOP 1030-1]
MSGLLTRASLSLLNILLTPLLTTSTSTSIRASAIGPPRFQLDLPIHPQCSAFNLYRRHNSTFYSTMSTTSSQEPQATVTADANAENRTQEQLGRKEYLALPDAGSANSASHELDVSGDGSSVKLDHLGPLVVNQDGTLSRISNWEQMTEIERRNTLRVLGKRNKLRMDAIKEQQNQGQQN